MVRAQICRPWRRRLFKRSLKRILSSLMGLVLVLLLAATPGSAQKAPQLPVVTDHLPGFDQERSSVSPTSEKVVLNDPQEFENFIDQLIGDEIAKSSVPGVVISVVKDGEIFFAKGYGYANLAENIPVDVDRTLFRVASLSKLFTATATMQLYEQGLLDVNEDVSPYLDFKLDNPFSEPVTFARLMMHTDGSTVRRIGLAAQTEAEMTPLGKYLTDHMPPIAWQPGKLYSYSSHSTALLGYLVEKISGTPFAQYIDEHILQPLDMPRSTFLQPPPPELADNLAVGYQKQGGTFKPVPYLYLNIAPAASLSATATDMAHFMIAHLLDGRYQDERILQPETTRLMHETHFTQHPKLPGTGYSFRERLVNNIRTIGHLGSLRGYSSSLTLMPDQNIGIFVAANAFSGIHSKLLTQFFDRYFPASEDPAPLSSSIDIDPNRFTGVYRDLEFPRHTMTKISGVFKHIRITAGEDESLLIQTPNLFFLGNPGQTRLVPIEPQLFRRAGDNALTSFGEGTEGDVAFAFNPIYPKLGAYERVPWHETIWVQLGLAGVCTVFFLSACVAWLIRPLIQQIRGKRSKEKPFDWALNIAGIVGLLNLVFLIGLPLYFWLIGVWKLVYGVPTVAIALLCLPLIAAALTFVLPVVTVTVWNRGYWSFQERSHYLW
ncbi:serine hydrolase domain-containing protein [Leptolyngbya sp. FACHB-541]|uniref:serine hydrolase domain-containing protein n=1 Tax=Leptolyngbya sp. FACHB-541 TaxID=2692810 RepID=UPI0018F01C77|nr:serine hydrolase domain-containing protein [Leptolyngbya sp. FACHB-541]